MSVVDNPPIPTKHEDRVFKAKVFVRILAAVMIAGGTVALVYSTATSNSQQATIDRNNLASLCRSRVVAETDGVINGSLALMLQDPQADGIVEILDSIVLLGNRSPLNFDEIAKVSQDIRGAQVQRKQYVQNVTDAIQRREQAIQLCEPKESP